MIFTHDDALAGRMRQIMVHGQERRYHHVRIGLNARLDTLQAAVLLGKWPHFEAEMAARSRNGALYNERLSGVPGVTVPVTSPGNSHVFAQYSIQVPDRDALGSALAAEGIPTAVHYPVPLHLQPAFGHLGQGAGSYPVSEEAARRIISLPMHPFLTVGEIDSVAAAVRRFQTGRNV
jgi:UDP-2-acetamido-2-deoxy-ribo-hexuluronate aminotransferase